MIELLGFPMALQFKRHQGFDWVYRKDQVGQAIPVTNAERDRYVRGYCWIMITGPFLLFLVVAVGAWIADKLFSSSSNGVQVLISTIGTVIALAALHRYLLYYSHAPARELAARPPVAPSLSLRVVHRRVLERMTNARLFRSVAVLTAIFGLGAFQPGISAEDRPVALIFCLTLPLAIGAGFWLWRRRIEHG